MEYEKAQIIVSCISLFFAFAGGCFALWQWHKRLVYKRIEILNTLIKDVRENESIAAVMDLIDWDNIVYDGTFHYKIKSKTDTLPDEILFRKIDQTLAVYNYICYLKCAHTIGKKEMMVFSYELRRIADNQHISNYLYSLFHWSKSLNVNMSYNYLVEYLLDNQYLRKEFLNFGWANFYYSCYLKVQNGEQKHISWKQ